MSIAALSPEKTRFRIPEQDFFVAIEKMKIDYNLERSKVKVNGNDVTPIHNRLIFVNAGVTIGSYRLSIFAKPLLYGKASG